jgi:hypothetical protein
MEEISEVFFRNRDKLEDAISNCRSRDFPLALTMIYYTVGLGVFLFLPDMKESFMEKNTPGDFANYTFLAPLLVGNLTRYSFLKFDKYKKKNSF